MRIGEKYYMLNNSLKKKPIAIHSMRLAAYLMLRGFPLKALEQNTKKTSYIVHIFFQSEALDEAITSYKEDDNFKLYADQLKCN